MTSICGFANWVNKVTFWSLGGSVSKFQAYVVTIKQFCREQQLLRKHRGDKTHPANELVPMLSSFCHMSAVAERREQGTGG